MKKTIAFMICVLSISLFAQRSKEELLFKSVRVPLREHSRLNASSLGNPTAEDKATITDDSQGKWLLVKTTKSNKSGWVLQSELLKTVEYGTDVAQVAAENESLKAEKESLKAEAKKYKEAKYASDKELISTNRMFTQVQQKYTDLREGATAFADLQTKYDSTVAALEEEIKKNEEMTASVEEIKKNDRYRWFLTGGLLVLISYLLGISARKGKKGKAYNYR